MSMLVAIATVSGLAWWDEKREADAALQDLQNEEAILASSLAGSLRAHLATVERDARLLALEGRGAASPYDPVVVREAGERPAKAPNATRIVLSFPALNGRMTDVGVTLGDLLGGARGIVRAGDLTVLVCPPGDIDFRAVDGRVVPSPRLRNAIEGGASAVRLTRSEAVQVGLRERTAMAGLARVDGGPMGRWDVVAIASAASERDRGKWAVWRLVSSVLVASGLVLAFGGVALRKQRKELELAHMLAVSEVERERDEHLLRAERVATMGTFAMGIAHEVSTPLGVIVGRAEELLGRLGDDERGTRSAQAILKQADRIQHIIRRFLDMARGALPSFVRADPSGIVRAATTVLEHRFAKAGVSLRTNIPAAMPEIQCDRDLLEQAIVNVLLNACEACGPGGHVEVTARSDAECVVFVVSDDGIGITPESAARATEPFFTTKAARGGTGLGLAIATEIAKSHRGGLTIAPNTDRGTHACIEIPIAGHGGLHG